MPALLPSSAVLGTALTLLLPWTIASVALGDGAELKDSSSAASLADAACAAQDSLDLKSASCGKCHKTIYEQWLGSRHAAAWTNQPFKDWMSKKKKPQSCHKCHIPQSVIDIAPKQPKPRTDRLEEGVGCASCHVSGNKVHGPTGKECDAHTNVKSELFGAANVSLCQSCHRVAPKPVISLGKDFERAKLLEKGKNCRECHMPEFEGHSSFDPETGEAIGEKRKMRSHSFLGASHREMTAKAFKLAVKKTDEGFAMSISNECGHRLPGLTLRKYELRFALVDAKGEEVTGKDHTITTKKPLKLGKTIDITLPASANATAARVRFVHHWQAKPKGPWANKGQVLELNAKLPK